MTSKNDVLTSNLMFFLSEVQSRRDPADPPPPIPSNFTAITKHPSVGEIPPHHSPQCGAAPVNILVSFWSRAAKSTGEPGSQ